MKLLSTYVTVIVVLFSFLTTAVAQTSSAATSASTNRVAFMLKNSLGYHRMFRVEGPGIAYGFTMNRRETVPCNWPVGAKLYFSSDGETVDDHILTVTADDAGKTLTTGSRESASKVTKSQKPVSTPETSVEREVTVRFRNNSIKFQKVALITYEPGEPGKPGNSTNIFTLAPYAFTSRKFAVGTRVYFANDKQVDVVMSGQPLTDKPFLVVRKEDSGKLFYIFE